MTTTQHRKMSVILLCIWLTVLWAACSSDAAKWTSHGGDTATTTQSDLDPDTEPSGSTSIDTADTDTLTVGETDVSTGDSDGFADADGDGWLEELDCDDDDPEVNPGAVEVLNNGKDDDCDGEIDETVQTDTGSGDDMYPGSVDKVFEPGSLIIPMDLDYQDEGMLLAYGLVYQLLLAEVDVYWLIRTPKLPDDADFVASAKDVNTGADIQNHGYRGGPFAVAAVDAARAVEVVENWQKEHATAVHRTTAEFTGPVSRTMRNVPRIAILANGKEDISFDYMRAARIPDSFGQPWPENKDKEGIYPGYPDVLSVEEVRGPTDTDHKDGALFDSKGEPLYCELMTMHWDVEDRDEAAIAEIREYLHHPVHFFAECQSVNAVENAVNGRFLTPNGFVIDERPEEVDILNPYLPFSQIDGPFQTVGGSEPSYSLPEGDSYYDDGVVMVTAAGTPIGKQDVWMTGYLDGACEINDIPVTRPGGGMVPPPRVDCPGKISYLAGHKYKTETPISENYDTQGTRFFLNALFEADCVTNPIANR